jgi:hypothetical protein
MSDRRARRARQHRPGIQSASELATRPARDALANPTQGAPLDGATEGRLASVLGHDFSNVRIHHDTEADHVTRELDARALTRGQQIYFRAGAYAPETSDGLRVLAHEAAHVAQQARGEVEPTTDERGVVENDAETQERSAHQAADDVMRAPVADAAPAVHASAASAVVQRWPWDDDDPAKVAAAAPAQSGGSLWDTVSSAVSGAASTAYGAADSAGKSILGGEQAIGGAAKGAWDWVDSKYSAKNSDATKLQQQMNGGVNEKGEKEEGLVDKAENWLKQGNNKVLASNDDSVLGSLEKASAWMGNTSVDIMGGVVKGGMDLASMASNAIAHPIDSAVGMAGGVLSMAEHVPLIPGLNTTVKALHGAYDIASGNEKGQYGKNWGELGSHLFDPRVSGNDDLNFAAGMGGGVDAWKAKPGEAAARTITNLLPMFLGGEGAPVADAGEVASEARVAAGAGEPSMISPKATTLSTPAVELPPESAIPDTVPAENVPRASGPKNPVQIWQNIAQSGPGYMEMWQNMLKEGAGGPSLGGAGGAGSAIDLISPAAKSISPPALAPTVEMPVAPTVDMPGVTTKVMPNAPTLPGEVIGQQFGPPADPLARVIGGKMPGELGLPQLPGGGLDIEALQYQLKNPLAKVIPGKMPGELGLPVTADGGIDLAALIEKYGRG